MKHGGWKLVGLVVAMAALRVTPVQAQATQGLLSGGPINVPLEGGNFHFRQRRGIGNIQSWVGKDVQSGLINSKGKIVARRGSTIHLYRPIVIVMPPPILITYAAPPL